MLVTKQFSFSASHFLTNYHGKCENLHGHNYKLQITVASPVNPENGMAFDFAELKSIVKTNVISKLDHTHLNDQFPNPSAELIAIWIWDQLKDHLPLTEVKLFETENSWVTYKGTS
jgi:6-pyruvoyltetrahydropterin/6-carboxytetrahydropterin synthase